jgi:hypothetical protein
MINFITPNTMGHVVSAIMQSKTFTPIKQISLTHYIEWKNQYSFDGLRGLRYGQSFCNHFDIQDNILYYTTWDVDQLEDYIMKQYIQKSCSKQ